MVCMLSAPSAGPPPLNAHLRAHILCRGSMAVTQHSRRRAAAGETPRDDARRDRRGALRRAGRRGTVGRLGARRGGGAGDLLRAAPRRRGGPAPFLGLPARAGRGAPSDRAPSREFGYTVRTHTHTRKHTHTHTHTTVTTRARTNTLNTTAPSP